MVDLDLVVQIARVKLIIGFLTGSMINGFKMCKIRVSRFMSKSRI